MSYVSGMRHDSFVRTTGMSHDSFVSATEMSHDSFVRATGLLDRELQPIFLAIYECHDSFICDNPLNVTNLMSHVHIDSKNLAHTRRNMYVGESM